MGKHLEVLAADTTDNEGRSLEWSGWPIYEAQKVVAEAKQRREEKSRLREQQRQVSKVLLAGLYDPDSPISKLLGVRTEVVGQIFPEHRLPVDLPVQFPARKNKCTVL